MNDMASHPAGLPAADFTCIDLCAGAHGLGLGVSIAVPLVFPGFRARSVCHVEIEAFAAATLVGHMEAGTLDQAPVWSDLATFDGRPWRGRVHCVTSGDPCQPNSVAGKRLGEDDDRFLADQVIRVVDEVRPLCVFRENVPGNADGQLRVLVPALEAMGYRVECGLFSSAETGNSHGRKRLIILAYLPDIEGRLYAGQWRSGEGETDVGGAGEDMGDAAHDQRRGELETQGTRCRRAGLAGAGPELACPACGGRGRIGPFFPEGISSRCGNCELADARGAGLAKRLIAVERRSHVWNERAAPGANRADVDPIRHSAGCPPDILARGVPRPDDPVWPELLQSRPEFVPAHSRYDRFEATVRDAGFAPDGRPLTDAWQNMAQRVDARPVLKSIREAVFQKAAQCHLRGSPDALAQRVDRLRLLGNGVDPVVAAYAWLCLDARHREREVRDNRPRAQRGHHIRADEPAVRVA